VANFRRELIDVGLACKYPSWHEHSVVLGKVEAMDDAINCINCGQSTTIEQAEFAAAGPVCPTCQQSGAHLKSTSTGLKTLAGFGIVAAVTPLCLSYSIETTKSPSGVNHTVSTRIFVVSSSRSSGISFTGMPAGPVVTTRKDYVALPAGGLAVLLGAITLIAALRGASKAKVIAIIGAVVAVAGVVFLLRGLGVLG
jgi:hypothetical protein